MLNIFLPSCHFSRQHTPSTPVMPNPGASGNIATEDIVHMLDQMGIETGISLEKAIETARIAAKMVGHAPASSVLLAGACKDLTKENVHRQQNR